MIPDYQTLMLPVLKLVSDESEHSFQEIVELLASEFSLSLEERATLLPSGMQQVFDNRVGWAKTYLKKAGLIEYPKRGWLSITDRGKEILNSNPTRIDNRTLKQFDEFLEFQSAGSQDTTIEESETTIPQNSRTPQELIEAGVTQIEKYVRTELLEKLKIVNPYSFEKIVLILLKKMGYGEFIETPKSRDGGIDGIINEDQLGLDKIYIQAKRFTDNKVHETDIRNFIGAMSGDTEKGIFVTTSDFDEKAKSKASDARHKIILINGEKLVDLMVRHNVGVQLKSTIEIKAIDNDFFENENI